MYYLFCCKKYNKVRRTGACAVVDWTLTLSMTEVRSCDVEVMQSACVVSRVFTPLIALLGVGELAGTCCCGWSRDVLDATADSDSAPCSWDWWRKCLLPAGLVQRPMNWKKPEAERGRRHDDGQTNELDLMMTYGLDCRQIATLTDRAAQLTMRCITFNHRASSTRWAAVIQADNVTQDMQSMPGNRSHNAL